MAEYLLLLRDHEQRWERFGPADFQRIINEYAAWNERLAAEERLVAAGKLTNQLGGTVRSGDSGIFIDGPYAEAKEAIAGYYQVRAGSLEDAYEIARGCPILTYGGSVEVREMMAAGSPDSCSVD